MSYQWNQENIPHKGWRCVDVIDLRPNNEPVELVNYATCEMCGHEKIRYVHVMEHDNFEGQLDAGCVCAEKMLDDYVGPRERERRLKNKAARKRNWLQLQWKTSRNGNSYIKKDGMVLTVFPNKFRPGRWSFGIDGEFFNGKYESEDAAKLALFEEYWNRLE